MTGKILGLDGAITKSALSNAAVWSTLYVTTMEYHAQLWCNILAGTMLGVGPNETESVCRAASICAAEVAMSQQSCMNRHIMSPGIFTASGFKTTARRFLESLSTAWLWRKLRRALPWRLRRVLAALSGRVQKKRSLGGAPRSESL